jgi:HAD superfamily hydrolase (TIGR01509 family)
VPPRYVIFDCDGVLVDSEPISNRLLAQALTRIGLPTTTEDSIDAYMGRSWDTNVAEIEARLGRPVPDDLRARVNEDMFAAFRRELAPVPGIDAALQRIELPRCVASSSDPAHLRFVLEHTGLLEHVGNHLFSAAEVQHGKPAPDLFLHAAAQMGWAPADCAVVEDSPAGVQAGLAAGMTVFGYAGLTDPALLDGARVFTSMDELPELLQPPV